MKLTFKFTNTENLSIGMPMYKDDTEIGKVDNINKETGDVIIDINPMFNNWVTEVANQNQSIGISSKKQPRRL